MSLFIAQIIMSFFKMVMRERMWKALTLVLWINLQKMTMVKEGWDFEARGVSFPVL